MKGINALIALLLAVLFSLVSCRKEPVSISIQNRLDKATESNFDGVILSVYQDGEVSLYSAGMNNKEQGIVANPNQLFKIASISKLYIASACAKLIGDGTLSVDQTLAEYLPQYAARIEYADEITLKMLLQHRSGIPDFIDDGDFSWATTGSNVLEALELALDKKAEFKPNKRRKYSNTNYLLIGLILDSELGYSHHEYITSEILNPLGLSQTYATTNEVDEDAIMSGYDLSSDDDLKTWDYFIPGGSMVATAEEVSVFISALNEGNLLTATEQSIYEELYDLDHTGLLPGYQSIARYDDKTKSSVVLFMNTSGGNSWSRGERLFRRIVRDLRWCKE